MKNELSRINQKLRELYSITGVPSAVFSQTKNARFFFPEPPEEETSDYHLDIIYDMISTNHVPLCTPFLTCIASSTLIGILQLKEDLVVVFGPAALHSVNMHNYLSYLTQKYSPELVSYHMKLVQGTPKVDFNYFCNILIHATDFLCSKVITTDHLQLSDTIYEINYAATDKFISRNHISVQQLSFASDLYDLVKTGNIELLSQRLEQMQSSSYYLFQENGVHVLKFSYIFYASLLSHYAYLGGLSVKVIKGIFFHYIKKITACSRPEFYWKTLSDFSLELCRGVRELENRPSYDSDIIRISVAYIEDNLYHPLTIKDLEAQTYATSKTISRHFMKYLNTTPAQYISDEKLKEAAYLLRETDLKIIEISHLLHYSSQSHLNRNFFKKYNCSPLQYRTEHRGR